MEKQPLLSVIVPVYNAAAYLTRCVDSLLAQTYGNLEILLIDDGSTDDSPQLCDAYARRYERIHVLHKTNAGAGMARSSGLDMVRGAYVAFADSDDYIDVQMYQCLMEQLLCCHADAAFCDYCRVRSSGALEPEDSGLTEGKHPAREVLLGMLGARPEGRKDFDFDWSTCKAVYSMDVIRTYHIRFPSEREFLCEDLLFNLEFLRRAGSAVYVKRALYYYCENAGSFTRTYMTDRLTREKKLFALIRQQAADILQDEERLRWHRLFLGRVRSTISQYVFFKDKGSFRQRMDQIRRIANDEVVRSVIESYPIQKNPIKLRVFHVFLKWRFCIGMYVLIILNR